MSSFFFSVDNLTLSGPLFLQFLFIFHICSSFIFVHLSSSTQPESVGSNPALNHKFFKEFFGIVRPKNTFFSKKNQNFFLKKNFFPNFSNSCSLNIFEPKIWRRLGTFPSCFKKNYSTVIKKSSPYALNVVINQVELLICSHFQFWLAHQVKSQAQKEHFCYFPNFRQVFEILFWKFLIHRILQIV